jgi:hypothetical protein
MQVHMCITPIMVSEFGGAECGGRRAEGLDDVSFDGEADGKRKKRHWWVKCAESVGIVRKSVGCRNARTAKEVWMARVGAIEHDDMQLAFSRLDIMGSFLSFSQVCMRMS